jgi:hypothetical protein
VFGSHRKPKLRELFARWLVKPENTAWLNGLLDDMWAGKDNGPAAQRLLHGRVAAAPPGSPVSHLIHSHVPFGGSPRPFHNSGPTIAPHHHHQQQHQRHRVAPPQQQFDAAAGDLELGRTCADRSPVLSAPRAAERFVPKTDEAVHERTVHDRRALATGGAPHLGVDGRDEAVDKPRTVSRMDVDFATPARMDASGAEIGIVARADRTGFEDSAAVHSGPRRPQSARALSPLASEGVEDLCHLGGGRQSGVESGPGDAAASSSPGRDAASADPPSDIASSTVPRRMVSVPSTLDSARNENHRRGEIAPFYFPLGNDAEGREERERQAIHSLFGKIRDAKGGAEGVNRTEFAEIVVQAIALPSFFAPIIFDRVLQVTSSEVPPPARAGRGKAHVSLRASCVRPATDWMVRPLTPLCDRVLCFVRY